MHQNSPTPPASRPFRHVTKLLHPTCGRTNPLRAQDRLIAEVLSCGAIPAPGGGLLAAARRADEARDRLAEKQLVAIDEAARRYGAETEGAPAG